MSLRPKGDVYSEQCNGFLILTRFAKLFCEMDHSVDRDRVIAAVASFVSGERTTGCDDGLIATGPSEDHQPRLLMGLAVSRGRGPALHR